MSQTSVTRRIRTTLLCRHHRRSKRCTVSFCTVQEKIAQGQSALDSVNNTKNLDYDDKCIDDVIGFLIVDSSGVQLSGCEKLGRGTPFWFNFACATRLDKYCTVCEYVLRLCSFTSIEEKTDAFRVVASRGWPDRPMNLVTKESYRWSTLKLPPDWRDLINLQPQKSLGSWTKRIFGGGLFVHGTLIHNSLISF